MSIFLIRTSLKNKPSDNTILLSSISFFAVGEMMMRTVASLFILFHSFTNSGNFITYLSQTKSLILYLNHFYGFQRILISSSHFVSSLGSSKKKYRRAFKDQANYYRLLISIDILCYWQLLMFGNALPHTKRFSSR